MQGKQHIIIEAAGSNAAAGSHQSSLPPWGNVINLRIVQHTESYLGFPEGGEAVTRPPTPWKTAA